MCGSTSPDCDECGGSRLDLILFKLLNLIEFQNFKRTLIKKLEKLYTSYMYLCTSPTSKFQLNVSD